MNPGGLAEVFVERSKKVPVVGAVGKVKIPLGLRDFQVEWKSPAFGLFHPTAFSTAPCPLEGVSQLCQPNLNRKENNQ